ncbi:MmgE/PrpD family protein [Micromonospora sp. NPDC005161]
MTSPVKRPQDRQDHSPAEDAAAVLDADGVDRTTRAIARFAHSLRLEDIPERTRVFARQIIVDSIACAYGGVDCDAVEMAARLAPVPAVEDIGGVPIIRGGRTTADTAAFLNTAMVRFLDFNDSFPTAHPSDSIGALLGAAAAEDVSGGDLLTAVVVEYEVFNRLTESARMRYLGWDQGAAVAVAVAAGLGNMLRMDEMQIVHAVSLAAVSCVPLRATRAGSLSLWKGAATAEAAREATYLTQLARLGMTGPTASFEGRHGHWELITGPFELRPFPPTGEYLLEFVRLKYWPLEYNIQIVVWAALELRKQVPLDELESVQIGTYWSAWHETASEPEKWAPKTRETADHSMPYVFARVLIDGTIDVSDFEPERYEAPDVLELMQRISVHEDAEIEALYPATVAAKVTATTTSGETSVHQLENPRGHDLNRMSVEETSDKFRKLSVPVIGLPATERALEAWWRLDDQASASAAVGLLARRDDIP